MPFEVERRFPSTYCPVEAMRLQRLGKLDPAMRLLEREVWKATRTPEGDATIVLRWDGEHMHVLSFGPGAAWIADRAPRLCGHEDDPAGLVARHDWLASIVRDHPQVSLGQAPRLFDTLISYVLQQRVAFADAAASWRRILEHVGEPAPGALGLLLPPSPDAWRSLGLAALASFDVDGQRARILHEVALQHRKIDRLDDASLADARMLVPKLRGIGPWTAGMVLGVGRGDPDAVPEGDVSMPSIIARAFTGEARGDDQRMLELLQDYQGQRFRVLRLVFAAGIRRQRFGPRVPRTRAPRGFGR